MLLCQWMVSGLITIWHEPLSLWNNGNRYPYPLFEILDFKGRIALFTASAFLMALDTVTLKWLYGRVNGYGRSEYPQARPGHVKEPDFHIGRS